MIKKQTKKDILIFDMDGTLYKFKGGSFRNSNLKKRVLKNARLFISAKLNKNKAEAKQLLEQIQKDYGEDISIALEEKFDIDRRDYFSSVWNIPAKNYIKKGSATEKALLEDASKRFILVLLSDAPRIWVDNVLEEIGVKDIFDDNIFSGEGDERKGFKNAFDRVFKKFKTGPKNCIIFGDQENVDILPAVEIGMKTVFVNDKEKSNRATYNVKSIAELPALLADY